jgi:hypothetical protein
LLIAKNRNTRVCVAASIASVAKEKQDIECFRRLLVLPRGCMSVLVHVNSEGRPVEPFSVEREAKKVAVLISTAIA